MIDIDAALTFTSFVAERHRIWEQRQAGAPQPWTGDSILESKKFTNVFRILDPGTQFVMTDLIDPELAPEDQLMRLFLYRHTGRVEAWQYLSVTSGYPTRTNLEDVRKAWHDYRGEPKIKTRVPWTQAGKPGAEQYRHEVKSYPRTVFTGAYLVFPQSAELGTNKLDSIIDLTRRLFVDGDTGTQFVSASSQPERFAALRRNKGVADFMSFQCLTDWGYTPHCGKDRENEFVVPGPGAVKGARLVDPHRAPVDTVRWLADALWAGGAPALGDRLPSYADVQNCCCEFFKYDRLAAKPLSGKPYKPAHPGPQPSPVLPAHW